jgi:AcrR family transcriptional regulator
MDYKPPGALADTSQAIYSESYKRKKSMTKRGRPSSFDRGDALQSAMELFWEKGYEGTTLEDLQASMGGISPPSFYNAFGSKEALFREAADLYVEMVGGPSVKALQETSDAREAMETMLRLTAEFLSQRGKPHGCLLVLGATKCAPANKGAQDYLRAIRQEAPKVIKQRLDRAVAEGDLTDTLDTNAVTAFYATVLHGLGVRAGDGASRSDLLAAVDGAMGAWETLVAPSNPPLRGRKRSSRR